MGYSEEQRMYISAIIENTFGGRHVDAALLEKYQLTNRHLLDGDLDKDDLHRITNILDLEMSSLRSCGCSKEEQTMLFECQSATRILLHNVF